MYLVLTCTCCNTALVNFRQQKVVTRDRAKMEGRRSLVKCNSSPYDSHWLFKIHKIPCWRGERGYITSTSCFTQQEQARARAIGT